MMPEPNGCIGHFGSQAEHWRSLYRTRATFRDRLETFKGALRQVCPPPARVLDFGCGPGVMSLDLGITGYQVLGVDGAPEMIQVAENERNRLGLQNVSFGVAEAGGFCAPSASFDAVICSSVIEYLENDLALLEMFARAIRPGGVLLLSVPHTRSIVGALEDVLARKGWLKRCKANADHSFSKRRYDRRRLLATLRDLSLGEFRCRFFELPMLGAAGIPPSRIGWLGVMLLITAVKVDGNRPSSAQRRLCCTESVPRPPVAWSRKNLWEAAPSCMRAILTPLARVLPPAFFLGRRFRRTLAFARASQRWSQDEVIAHQIRCLQNICQIAYERTSYYRRVFDSVGFRSGDLESLDDMATLPTIDRDVVREHLEEMGTCRKGNRTVDFVSTSGTSGVPLFFYVGRERHGAEYAYLVASWERGGYSWGASLAVLRGRVVRPDRHGLHHEYDSILRHHCYSSFHMTDENMGRYLAHIATIGPCFLHVYPSSVAALAKFIRRAGVKAPGNIRGIIAESETIYPEQRQMVEEVFGCRYFSCYGHSEKLVLAAECEFSTDYHVWPTYGYLELLDEQGRPVTTPGQRGEIVGTGFINTVMPFIRYRTGDYATYVGDHCEACGRQHPIIRDIRGHRTQEVLVAADGSRISWTALNMHDDTFLHVRQFQFRQDAPGRAVLRVVPAEGFGDGDQQRIQRNFGQKLDGQVVFAVELVESIPLSPRGKAIYVDQRIKEPHASEGPA